MSKIYLVAALCMVSAVAALPLDDGLTPRPKLPSGSEDIITPKPNNLNLNPQPNKADELNEESKGNKDSKAPQKGENSKELNKPDDFKESGEDKKKGPSSEELVIIHGDSGEKRPDEPIPMKNPSLLMSYLNWLLGRSPLGSRSDHYDEQPSVSIIALPVHADSQELIY